MGSSRRTTLDEAAEELLESDTLAPRANQVTIAELRRAKRESLKEGRKTQTPQGETDVRQFRIPGEKREIPVRIYTPVGADNVPVVVWFHGGGFVSGSLDSNDSRCRYFADALHCSVVSVGYRLAPENPFPAAVEDCYTAAEWAVDNPEVVCGDSEKIGVGGSSAGGNLAAAVCLLARHTGGPELNHQMVFVGCLDPTLSSPSYTENAEGYRLTREEMAQFWDHYLEHKIHALNPCAAPILAPEFEGLPPALIVTAGFDPLRDDGYRYAELLRGADVPVEHLHFPQLPHHISWLFRHEVETAERAYEEIIDRWQALIRA